MPALWILGAADPEMAAIETMLTGADERFAFAALGTERVHPGNAYTATGIVSAPGRNAVADSGSADSIIMVECMVASYRGGRRPITVIDHHRPGDPG